MANVWKIMATDGQASKFKNVHKKSQNSQKNAPKKFEKSAQKVRIKFFKKHIFLVQKNIPKSLKKVFLKSPKSSKKFPKTVQKQIIIKSKK